MVIALCKVGELDAYPIFSALAMDDLMAPSLLVRELPLIWPASRSLNSFASCFLRRILFLSSMLPETLANVCSMEYLCWIAYWAMGL